MKNEVLQIVLTMRQSIKPGCNGKYKHRFPVHQVPQGAPHRIDLLGVVNGFLLTRMVECNSVIGVWWVLNAGRLSFPTSDELSFFPPFLKTGCGWLFFRHHDLVKRWTLVLPYLSILCGTLAIVCEGGSMISVNASPSAPSFLRFNDYSIWRLSGLVGRAADL